MKFLALTAAAILVLPFSAKAEVRPAFERSLELLASGHNREAYENLNGIEMSAPDFSKALTEAQKIHYRHQDWSKFFAYAQFYRLRYAEAHVKEPLSARPIALEAMALAKHCLWNTADEVLAWAESKRERFSASEWNEIEDTRDILLLHASFPKTARAREDAGKTKAIFSREHAWKLQAKALAAINHPKSLSVRLKSECGE